MNAGLPGTGIGGVFYLVSALLMPFLELFKTLRGESNLGRWLLVTKQLVMAGTIMGGMWLMGLILGVVVNWSGAIGSKLGKAFHLGYTTHLAKLNVFHIAPLVISLFTLSTIYLLTHMMRFVYAPAVAK
jgi:hypothetical protein